MLSRIFKSKKTYKHYELIRKRILSNEELNNANEILLKIIDLNNTFILLDEESFIGFSNIFIVSNDENFDLLTLNKKLETLDLKFKLNTENNFLKLQESPQGMVRAIQKNNNTFVEKKFTFKEGLKRNVNFKNGKKHKIFNPMVINNFAIPEIGKYHFELTNKNNFVFLISEIPKKTIFINENNVMKKRYLTYLQKKSNLKTIYLNEDKKENVRVLPFKDLRLNFISLFWSLSTSNLQFNFIQKSLETFKLISNDKLLKHEEEIIIKKLEKFKGSKSPVELIREINDSSMKNKFKILLQPEIEKIFKTFPKINLINGSQNVQILQDNSFKTNNFYKNKISQLILKIIENITENETIISIKDIKYNFNNNNIILIESVNNKEEINLNDYNLIINMKNLNKYEVEYKKYKEIFKKGNFNAHT